MANQKVDLFSHINTWAIKPAKRAYTKLENQWHVLGRQVSEWTDSNLPDPWNKVAKKIFYSLPIAAAIFSFPLSLNIAAGIGCYIVDLGYGPFSQDTYDTFYVGAFTGAASVALYNVGGLVTTLKPSYLLGAAIYGVMARILFPHAKFAEA